MKKSTLKKATNAYHWLYEHPIFKGRFKDQFYFSFVGDAVHGEKNVPKVLMEISIYDWDRINDDDEKSWISFANDDFDIWADSFEEGIIELAKIVKDVFGDYTTKEYWHSYYELRLGVKPGSKKAKKAYKDLLKRSENFFSKNK